jgi:hypothetical protein
VELEEDRPWECEPLLGECGGGDQAGGVRLLHEPVVFEIVLRGEAAFEEAAARRARVGEDAAPDDLPREGTAAEAPERRLDAAGGGRDRELLRVRSLWAPPCGYGTGCGSRRVT